MDEFELIERAFRARAPVTHPWTRISNGDDASVHAGPDGMDIVVSTDTSVAGRHWPEDAPLDRAAARAVNAALSDLAAMGAEAAWCWLNVMAREAGEADVMGEGATRALAAARVELAGGDTVRAPMNALAVTVAGLVPEGRAMRRGEARAGDDLWLAGECGLAAWALAAWQAGRRDAEARRFLDVRPLLAEGVRVREAGVRCCIDVSDGLLADAGHVARASGVGLEIRLEDVSGFAWLGERVEEARAARLVLAGGEDYALLFAAPPELRERLAGLGSRVGACVAAHPGRVRATLRGRPVACDVAGFRHFG